MSTDPKRLPVVRCSAWLGRWWIGIRCTVARRTDPVFRALLCKGWWRYCHDWMPLAFGAVWVRLKSCGRALPQHAHALCEASNDWLRILKLCAKLTVFYFKLRYLRRKQRILLDEQRQLLLQQVDHVFGQTVGVGDANNFFGDLSGTHSVKRPNDPSSATRPTGRVDCNSDAMAGFAAAHG